MIWRAYSDIVNIDDAPNDDGYCDDGEDDEDTYSVFSPKPCTIDEQDELGLSDIEKEDTPPMSVDETINDASIEVSKKDGLLVEECPELAESRGNDAVSMRPLDEFLDAERFKAAKCWRSQVAIYESNIIESFKNHIQICRWHTYSQETHGLQRLQDMQTARSRHGEDKRGK